MSSEFGFSDADFRAMTHPEGVPGQLTAIYGDRGTAAVLANTASLTEYYKALAFRASAQGALLSTLIVAVLLALVPALVFLWMWVL